MDCFGPSGPKRRYCVDGICVSESLYLTYSAQHSKFCLSACHGPARYLFFVLMTLYQLLRELLRMNTNIASYTRLGTCRYSEAIIVGTPAAGQSLHQLQ